MTTQIAFLKKEDKRLTLVSTEANDFQEALRKKEEEGFTVIRISDLFSFSGQVEERCYRLGFWPAVSLTAGRDSKKSRIFFYSPEPLRSGGRSTYRAVVDNYGIPTEEGISSLLVMDDDEEYYLTPEGELVTRFQTAVLMRRSKGGMVVNNYLSTYPTGWAPAQDIPSQQ